MRLTLEVLGTAEHLTGPSKERILSLRGLKIPAIENLGATGDVFDILDLSSNTLIQLDNFPPLKRLESLLLSNNRIVKMDAEVFDNLPSLKSLVLTNNRLGNLSDILPLERAKNLERLALIDNPVIQQPYYRFLMIYLLPQLRFLDFHKVKQQDRLKAKNFFTGSEGLMFLNKLKRYILPSENIDQAIRKSDTASMNDDTPPSPAEQQTSGVLTPEQINILHNAISKASNVADIERYEKALNEGQFLAELQEQTS